MKKLTLDAKPRTTKAEQIIAYLDKHGRTAQASIYDEFGLSGHVGRTLRSLGYHGQIKKERCECGHTVYWDIA